jgi:hypothetical protein
MITPEKQKHTLYQGATWEWTYRVVDESKAVVDLSGCTASLMARENVEDTVKVIDVAGAVNGPAGEVTFVITPDMTTGKNWEQAVFDAELYFPASSRIEKLAVGSFKLVQEVTRV